MATKDILVPWDGQPQEVVTFAPEFTRGARVSGVVAVDPSNLQVIGFDSGASTSFGVSKSFGVGARLAGPTNYVNGDTVADAGPWTLLIYGVLLSSGPSALMTTAESPGSGTRDRSLFIGDSGQAHAYIYDGTGERNSDTSGYTVPVGVPVSLAAVCDGVNLWVAAEGVVYIPATVANTGYSAYTTPELVIGYGGGGASDGGNQSKAGNFDAAYALKIDRAFTAQELTYYAQYPWKIFADQRIQQVSAAGGGVSGTVAFTLADDSITASGTATIKGSAAFTLASDSITASGTTKILSTAAFTLGSDTITASGTTTVKSSGAFTLGSDTMTASGAVGNNVNGTAAFSLASDTITASGTTKVLASAAFTLTGDSITASGTTKILSVASFTLDGVTMAAYGVSGSTSFTFPPCAIYVGGNIAIGTNGQPIVIFF